MIKKRSAKKRGDKNWMQSAVKRPGALRAKAAKAHAINKKSGKINKSWIDKEAKMDAKTPAQKRTKKQAVLAKTFAKHRRGRA